MAGINDRVFTAMHKRLDGFKDEFAKEFEKRVEQRTPVDTGKLKRGWKSIKLADSTLVGNDVKYANHVEEGTEHMAGAHMLKVTVAERNEIAKHATKMLLNKHKGPSR